MTKFAVKDRVYAEFEEGWFGGKVLSQDKKGVKIKFDDGEVEVIPADEVRTESEHKSKTKSLKKKKEEIEEKDDDINDDFAKQDDSLGDDDAPKKHKEEEEPDDAPEDAAKRKLEKMSRAELKEYIEEEGLSVRANKSMSDDDLREAILEEQKSAAENEVEEETPRKKHSSDEEDEPPKKKHPAEDDDDDDEPQPKRHAKDEDDEPKKKSAGDEEEEPAETGNWFSVGDEDDEAFAPPKRGMFRFWMQPKDEKDITFITGQPLTYREHTVKMSGNFYQFTCLAPLGQRCPLCESNNRPYRAKAFFIIDHTKYTNKKTGAETKDNVRLAVFKDQSYEILKKIAGKYFKGQDEWNFTGLRLTAERSGAKKSPNTGDIFIVDKKTKVDPELREKHDQEALKKEVAPLSRKDLLSKLPLLEDMEFSDKREE